MTKKSKLKRLKQNIIRWKEEGYKVEDIEELVKFVENQEQSPQETPRKKIPIFIASIFSFLISIIFIIGIIPYALFYGNQLLRQSTFPFSFRVGFPLNWFSITYDQYNSKYIIDYMEISNMLNLIVDFIFYIIVVFTILIIIDFVIKKKVTIVWEK